jgi:hypothetical protein
MNIDQLISPAKPKINLPIAILVCCWHSLVGIIKQIGTHCQPYRINEPLGLFRSEPKYKVRGTLRSLFSGWSIYPVSGSLFVFNPFEFRDLISHSRQFLTHSRHCLRHSRHCLTDAGHFVIHTRLCLIHVFCCQIRFLSALSGIGVKKRGCLKNYF